MKPVSTLLGHIVRAADGGRKALCLDCLAGLDATARALVTVVADVRSYDTEACDCAECASRINGPVTLDPTTFRLASEDDEDPKRWVS